MKKDHLYAGLEIVLALVIIFLSLMAQLTSRITPYLAPYPALLQTVGSWGVILLFLASAGYLIAAIYSHQPLYLWLGSICLIISGLARFTLLGTIFQLALAGLTVGGSLLLLGCLKLRPPK